MAVAEALGRSRGGLTTKIHLVCDRHGIPLGVVVGPGQRHDAWYLPQVLQTVRIRSRQHRTRSRPQQVVADKAYDARWVRQYLRSRRIRAIIPARRYQRRRVGRPTLFVKEQYRQRNVIERVIGHLKEHRRLATRVEKLARRYRAIVVLACIRLLLNRYFSDSA